MTTIDAPAALPAQPLSTERSDLLAGLAHARFFLRCTVRDLSTEQASRRTTVSALTLGGLIKHVTGVERAWGDFVVSGAAAMQKDGRSFTEWTDEDFAEREQGFQMRPTDTVASVLDRYAEVATRTDQLLRDQESLDVVHRLPEAPWNTEDSWSVRRVFLHIIAETTQHAGHADIIRESLDGAKSMG